VTAILRAARPAMSHRRLPSPPIPGTYLCFGSALDARLACRCCRLRVRSLLDARRVGYDRGRHRRRLRLRCRRVDISARLCVSVVCARRACNTLARALGRRRSRHNNQIVVVVVVGCGALKVVVVITSHCGARCRTSLARWRLGPTRSNTTCAHASYSHVLTSHNAQTLRSVSGVVLRFAQHDHERRLLRERTADSSSLAARAFRRVDKRLVIVIALHYARLRLYSSHVSLRTLTHHTPPHHTCLGVDDVTAAAVVVVVTLLNGGGGGASAKNFDTTFDALAFGSVLRTRAFFAFAGALVMVVVVVVAVAVASVGALVSTSSVAAGFLARDLRRLDGGLLLSLSTTSSSPSSFSSLPPVVAVFLLALVAFGLANLTKSISTGDANRYGAH
jgi:hypothetical protein